MKVGVAVVIRRSSLVNMVDFNFVASHLYDAVCLGCVLDIGVGVNKSKVLGR